MKKLFLLFALVSVVFADPYKVRVCQVEYMRGGARSPDPMAVPAGLQLIEGTPGVGKGYSDHATQVFDRLVSGPAAGLVGSAVECEAVSFCGPARFNPLCGLNGSRTLDPAIPSWDVENHSWGGHDPLFENDSTGNYVWTSQLWGAIRYLPGILSRESKRLEAYNIIACIALPDPGDPATRLLCAAQSRNIIKVGSSYGEVTTPEYTPDVVGSEQWTSYDCPDIAQTVIAMVSYLKTNGIAYNAGDVAQIVKDVAKSNGLYHDHAKCMALLYQRYPSISYNLPTPTSAPTPSPSPSPSPVPTATPLPSPTPKPLPTPSPTPVPLTKDQLCARDAAMVGASYSSSTGFTVTLAQYPELYSALKSDGLTQ